MSLDVVLQRKKGVIETSSTSGEATVMRSLRAMMSWLLLAAMLVSLPGGAAGHFVCNLGMAEAGPACPLCHGHSSAERPGLAVSSGCCKYVAGQPTPVSHLAVAQVEKPTLGHVASPRADTGLLLAIACDLTAGGGQPAIPRTPPSGYLSNFLRL